MFGKGKQCILTSTHNGEYKFQFIMKSIIPRYDRKVCLLLTDVSRLTRSKESLGWLWSASIRSSKLQGVKNPGPYLYECLCYPCFTLVWLEVCFPMRLLSNPGIPRTPVFGVVKPRIQYLGSGAGDLRINFPLFPSVSIQTSIS